LLVESLLSKQVKNRNMVDLKKFSDAELLEQIQAENMLAFDTVYKIYHKRLFHFSNYILKSKEDAENIVHEVFMKLWENRMNIRNIKSYIFGVAYNATISLIRKKAREKDFLEYLKSLPADWEAPVNIDIEYKELKERSMKIIDKLPDRQKEIYLLSRQDGLTYREISDKLNISVKTVENHLSRALKSIRSELGPMSFLGLLFFHMFI